MTTFPFEAQYKIGTETTWNRIDDDGVIVFDNVADTCVSHRATLRLEVKKNCTFVEHKFREADLRVEFNSGEEPVRKEFSKGETAEFEISFRDKNAGTNSELVIYIKDSPRPFTCKLKRDLESIQVDRAQSTIHALHQHFRTQYRKREINTVEMIRDARGIASSGKKFDPRDIDAVCELVRKKLGGEKAFNNADSDEAIAEVLLKFAADFKKCLLAPETPDVFIGYWKKARKNALRDLFRRRKAAEEAIKRLAEMTQGGGSLGKETKGEVDHEEEVDHEGEVDDEGIANNEANEFVHQADNLKRASICGLLLNAFNGLDDRDKLVLRLRYKNKCMGTELADAIHKEEPKYKPNANLANAWVVRAVNKLEQDLEVLFWEDCAFYVMDLTKNTLEEILDQILGGTNESFEVRREMVKSMLTNAKWELNLPRWPHPIT